MVPVFETGRVADGFCAVEPLHIVLMARKPTGRPIGRPHKGERVMTAVYLPRDVRDQVALLAVRRGLPVTDVVTGFVCQALGLPVPAYCEPTNTDQTELPIDRAS
jgi:hypothetical protein